VLKPNGPVYARIKPYAQKGPLAQASDHCARTPPRRDAQNLSKHHVLQKGHPGKGTGRPEGPPSRTRASTAPPPDHHSKRRSSSPFPYFSARCLAVQTQPNGRPFPSKGRTHLLFLPAYPGAPLLAPIPLVYQGLGTLLTIHTPRQPRSKTAPKEKEKQ